MNKLVKIVLTFLLKLLVPGKLVATDNIITHLTGNAAFVTPNPPLVTVQEKRDALAEKHALVMETETTLAMQRIELAQAEAELDLVLTQLSTYCESNCNNDPAVLESSGFELATTPQPVGPLPAPTDLRSEAGAAPGTSECFWKGPYGTKTFVAQCATSPAGPWTQFYLGTKARCTATGQLSGTLYYFRVAAVGAAGVSPWSDISEKRAP